MPGLDGTGRLFSPFLRHLPDNIQAIVLPYPNDRPMSYLELVHFLKDELPDTPYVLLGESFGGPLAVLLIKYADENLRGIVLCTTFVTNPQPVLVKIIRPFLKPEHLRKQAPSWFIKVFLTGGIADEKLIENIKRATHEMTQVVNYNRLKEIVAIDVTEVLKECEVPVLYLMASRDRLVKKRSMELIRSVAKKVTIQTFDAPHMLLQTKSGQTAKCITKFILSVL